MSVITPILDTLLHDVLGRRMAAPALRSLDETVTPVRPAAVLDPGQQETLPDVRGAGTPELSKALPRPLARPPPGAALQQGEGLPAGVQARLSPVALVIADVLGRFPAPPSALRIPLPLIPEQVPVSPPLLAVQLQSSINDSGLFYEAHLARWYRGALPLAQLLREPQMQLPLAQPLLRSPQVQLPLAQPLPRSPDTQPRTVLPAMQAVTLPAPGPAGNAGMVSTTPAPAPAGLPPPVEVGVGEYSRVHAMAPAALTAGEIGPPTDTAPLVRGEPGVSDALHGLVRHQLELLALPVLRWEGEVWAGIFMQLMIQLPDSPGQAERQEEGSDKHPGALESELTIQLSSLGLLNVKLHLNGEQLRLVLRTDSPRCFDYMETGREALAARLQQCGFGAPAIQIALSQDDADHE